MFTYVSRKTPLYELNEQIIPKGDHTLETYGLVFFSLTVAVALIFQSRRVQLTTLRLNRVPFKYPNGPIRGMRESRVEKRIINPLLVLFGLSVFWAMPTNARQLSGVVKSESGGPLAGVKVLTYAPLPEKRKLLEATLPTQRYEAETDKNERAWASGKTLGYEIRDVEWDGRLWRRVSFRWGAITYQGNSKGAAEALIV